MPLTNLQNELSSNPRYTIDVFGVGGKKIRTAINYDLILSEATDLSEFLKNIQKQEGVTSLKIQMKKPNGSSRSKVGEEINIGGEITINFKSPESQHRSREVMEVANSGQPMLPAPYQNDNSIYKELYEKEKQKNTQEPQGLNGGSFGLSGLEIMNLNTKSALYEQLQEAHKKLEKKYEKLEDKNDDLHKNLRQKDTENSISAQRLELAVEKAKQEQKGFGENPVFLKLIESITEIAPAMLGGGNETAGLSAPDESLSKIKQEIIQMVSSDNFTDPMADILKLVTIGVYQKKEFTDELVVLINNHKN